MPVTIKKLSNTQALDAVGLGAGAQPSPGVFEIGGRVRIVATTGPWRYICKTGDTGVVEKCAKANSDPRPSIYDLYFVRLDTPRVVNKEVAYLTYKELSAQ